MNNPNWWRGGVIYQVYPRSFQDTNHDGVGDLPGILQRLPYLADLGVDAVWISPFFKSPMADFGYEVSDYCDVDPLFGTLADFNAVVAKAHALGLKVIIDQVLSHCAEAHPWFVESRASRDNPRADWYVWADPKPDGTPPNNWLSVFGGPAWKWEGRRRQFYLHNFLESQPDLNFHHPEVQAAVLDNIRFWLDLGVDGFRFDACNFHFHDQQLRNNPPAQKRDATTVTASNPYGMQRHKYDKSQPENLIFLQRVRALLDEYGAASVGEVGDDNSLKMMADYTAGGDKLNMCYSFNLLTTEYSARFLRQQVSDLEAHIKDGWACWAISNHDVTRVMTRWGHDGNPDQAKLWLAILGSLRGSLCLYQGEELGLPEADITFEQLQDPYGKAFWPDFKGRDGCRTPMPWQAKAAHGGFTQGEPWLPVPDTHLARAADMLAQDPNSTLNFYRQFLAWRKTQRTLVEGDIRFIKTDEPLLAFTRHHQGQTVLCVFNLSAAPVCWRAPKRATALLGHGLAPSPSVDHTGLIKRGQPLEIPAFGGWLGVV